VEEQLGSYLTQQMDILKERRLKYVDKGKELYQIEVPKNSSAKIPSSWQLQSDTKEGDIPLPVIALLPGAHAYWAVRRFHTPEVLALLPRLADARYELEGLENHLQVREYRETFFSDAAKLVKVRYMKLFASFNKVATRVSSSFFSDP
jgi:hypothetical protein